MFQSTEQTVENLCFQLISESRKQPDAILEQLLSLQDPQTGASLAGQVPCWPDICEAVVAFQRRQGVNMNLVGPFKGQAYGIRAWETTTWNYADVAAGRSPDRC